MSLSRIHTFTNTTLEADDVNAEFDNIIYRFGNLTAGDLDLGIQNPHDYIVGTDASRLNEQIEDAAAAGKYLFLPAGIYSIDPMTLPAGTRIIGAGKNLVNISATNITTSTYWIRCGYTEDAYDILFKDLTLSAAISGGTNLILFLVASVATARNIMFDNVKMQSFAITGRAFVGVTVTDASLTFQDCDFEGYIHGFAVHPNTQLSIKRCRFINTLDGIVHSTNGTNGLTEVRDCYFQLDNTYTGETYYHQVKAHSLFSGNYYQINDGTYLTAVYGINGTNDCLTVIEFEQAIIYDIGASPSYWHEIDQGNVTVQFCCNEGPHWNLTRDVTSILAKSSGADDLRTRYGHLLNIDGTGRRHTVYTPVTTAAERRELLPYFTKSGSRNYLDDRGQALFLGDVYLAIDTASSGAGAHQLTLTRISESNQIDTAEAFVLMDGTTSLLD